MVEISDGFEISEEDYRLRGASDLMGTMQHGILVIVFMTYLDMIKY